MPEKTAIPISLRTSAPAPVEKTIGILETEKDEGQFDPRLIREFLAMLREEYDLTPGPTPQEELS